MFYVRIYRKITLFTIIEYDLETIAIIAVTNTIEFDEKYMKWLRKCEIYYIMI